MSLSAFSFTFSVLVNEERGQERVVWPEQPVAIPRAVLEAGSRLPVWWRSVSRHISQVSLLVSWEEEHLHILSACLPADSRSGTLAAQPRQACKGDGCLSTKSINTLQAAKSDAENNSTLLSIAPRTTWQERSLPGRCYGNNSFEVSTLIISILCL